MKALQNIMLLSRFVLIPMYIGLIVYMGLYDVAFFGALIDAMKDYWHNIGDFEKMKDILKLAAIDGIDMVMIGNLIIMIIIGSFSIFVTEIDDKQIEQDHLPRFIRGLTSGMLKIKMGASLVGVSSVHLLTLFVNIKSVGWDNLMKLMVIHLAFILGAFVFTVIESRIHPPHAAEPKPEKANATTH